MAVVFLSAPRNRNIIYLFVSPHFLPINSFILSQTLLLIHPLIIPSHTLPSRLPQFIISHSRSPSVSPSYHWITSVSPFPLHQLIHSCPLIHPSHSIPPLSLHSLNASSLYHSLSFHRQSHLPISTSHRSLPSISLNISLTDSLLPTLTLPSHSIPLFLSSFQNSSSLSHSLLLPSRTSLTPPQVIISLHHSPIPIITIPSESRICIRTSISLFSPSHPILAH